LLPIGNGFCCGAKRRVHSTISAKTHFSRGHPAYTRNFGGGAP